MDFIFKNETNTLAGNNWMLEGTSTASTPEIVKHLLVAISQHFLETNIDIFSINRSENRALFYHPECMTINKHVYEKFPWGTTNKINRLRNYETNRNDKKEHRLHKQTMNHREGCHSDDADYLFSRPVHQCDCVSFGHSVPVCMWMH